MSEFEAYLTRERNNPRVQILDPSISLDEIGREVAAFLNSDGGTLVITAGNHDARTIEKSLRHELPPATLLSVDTEDLTQGSAVVITIPPRKDHPVNREGTIYVREGNQTKVVDSATLRQMIQEQAIQVERWERQISVGFSLEDLDENEVNNTLVLMMQNGSFDSHEDSPSALSLTKQLGFLRADENLSCAADICLSKDPAIRNPQVRLRAFASISETDDEFQDHQTYSGPICQVLKNAENFVRRNTQQKALFDDTLTRKDIPTYPHKAIREGLVNALAHRDYSSHRGGITLRVFPDRVEIWNSGSLPLGWTISHLTSKIITYPENPDIANFLQQREYMERIGRGTQKIMEACKEARLPEPQWTAEDGVTLTFFAPISIEEAQGRLNSRQQALLKELPAGTQFRLTDYVNRTGNEVGDRQGRRDLSELEKLGFITKSGAGPSTSYIRT